ncbi:MAG: hypothetical protein OEM59_02220 [Rhodospirillales bacterium]|nr:hypothetical protein [Rhodospirillales bacterium]
MTKFQRARRAAQLFVWLLSAALLVAAAPWGALAQNFDPKDEIPDGFGHTGVGDLPTKRIETTGAGWFSLRGPYEDTANMNWLGQITNAEMQLQKIAQFNAPYMSDIWG